MNKNKTLSKYSGFFNRYILQIYIVVILALHILPLNSGGGLNNFGLKIIRTDYIAHCLIFIPLPMFLLNFAKKTNKWKLLINSILIAFFCEVIQFFLPYRAFNINDLLANLTGILIGFTMLKYLRKKWFNIKFKNKRKIGNN